MSDLPAITGKELIRLLVKDGWEIRRKMNHGMGLSKYFPEIDRHYSPADTVYNSLPKLFEPLMRMIKN